MRLSEVGTVVGGSHPSSRATGSRSLIFAAALFAAPLGADAAPISAGFTTGFSHDLATSTIDSKEGVGGNMLEVDDINLPTIGSATSAPGVSTLATAAVEFGELKVFASATAGALGLGRATAMARFNDTITLLETAQYILTAAPSWSLFGPCAADTVADATYTVELSLVAIAGALGSTCGGASLYPASVTFGGVAGQEISLTSTLGVRAYARGGTTTTADALSTGRFFLDGGLYETASGLTFYSVPEPSSIFLAGAALLGLALLRKGFS